MYPWKPCSRRRGPPDDALPDTHLTACDLHCNGVTAAWRAMFRNLMPSLQVCRAAGMGYTLQYCSQDNSRASTDRGSLTCYMRGGAFDGAFKALCTS